MSFTQKAKILRQNYANNGFFIFSCTPIGEPNENMKLSLNFTFSIKGNLPFIEVGHDYTLVLEEIDYNKQWGASYKVLEVPSLSELDLDNLTLEQSTEILESITTPQQTKYCLDAYPDFIKIALTQGVDGFDVKRIYNVKDVKLSCYVRLLLEKYKYLHMLNMFGKDYNVDVTDCKKLYDVYNTDEKIIEAFKSNPYKVLIWGLGRTFNSTDKLLLKNRPKFENSEIRAEFMMLDVLDRNEVDGSSRLDANILFQVCKEDYNSPQLLPLLKTVAVNSDLIHFDEKTMTLAKSVTYNGEVLISETIKKMLDTSGDDVWDIDWTKYTTIDDFQMTETQAQALKNLCESKVSLLIGYSGSGKAQPIDTIIPTPNGNKQLGDIKVGDYVYDRLGKPTKVLGVYPKGMRDCYTITLKDGRKTQCNDEHLWSYYTSKGNLATKTLREMMDSGITEKNAKYSIPICNVVEKELKNLPIDPYVIGSFIGKQDGSEVYTQEIYNNIIPREYIEGSIEQRYNLLQGLFDANGYISKGKEHRISYSTTSLQLAKDIQEILFSLGYCSSLHKEERENENTCYQINALIPNEEKYKLFRISKKKDIALSCKDVTEHRKYDRIQIVDVKKENYQKEMVCIYVDNDEHLYLTNDYIVTHNTTSTKGIVKLLEDNNKSYCLLSSTGKASRVLSESVNRKASTIHRRCYQGEIDCDCVLVDECSMIGIDVMCMLLNSLSNPNTHLVLVGDSAQASSVSNGRVFTDLIESNKIPTTMLTEIFRYKSNGSLFVATNVRQGHAFFDNKEMVKAQGNEYNVCGNYRFIDTTDVFENVINEYMKLIKKGVKPLNILCLSPMNKGDYGTVRINKTLQAEVNPPKPNEKVIVRKAEGTEFVFRVGDICVNIKNDYKALSYDAYIQMKNDEDGLLTEEDVANSICMNGQFGIIREINDDGMMIQFDEELLFFSKKKAYNLLLGYAISIHRSQGSTIDYSIEIVSEKHSKMLTRNLLYVGTTRNRISHVDIGDVEAFNKALQINDNDLRNTWLKELLTNE